jgi:hypothetical protein
MFQLNLRRRSCVTNNRNLVDQQYLLAVHD